MKNAMMETMSMMTAATHDVSERTAETVASILAKNVMMGTESTEMAVSSPVKPLDVETVYFIWAKSNAMMETIFKRITASPIVALLAVAMVMSAMELKPVTTAMRLILTVAGSIAKGHAAAMEFGVKTLLRATKALKPVTMAMPTTVTRA